MHIPFRPYMHVERLGTDEVEGILQGHCVISTKLDGTNTAVWLDDGVLRVGGRRFIYTPEQDNAGCAKFIYAQQNIRDYLEKHPTHILYGEFLVKQSIRTYVPTAWHKLYVFDVYDVERQKYLPYEEYVDGLKAFSIPYIPPIAIIDNPTQEDLERCLGECDFLNAGNPGEGIVIHNVDYKNKYGRTTFAKIVRKEYKQHKYTKDINKKTVEEAIVEKFCTDEFVEKEFQKLVTQMGGWNTKYIGRLLGTVYHTFIEEECWHMLKAFKNPTINFSLLNRLVVDKVKEVKNDLF